MKLSNRTKHQNEQKLISFTIINNQAPVQDVHRVLINKKKKELTIWRLYTTIATTTSETKFKKE